MGDAPERKLAAIRLTIELLEADRSGTPIGLLEVVRRSNRLSLLDQVDEGQVLVEFPFAEPWRSLTGYRRFVQLRPPGA